MRRQTYLARYLDWAAAAPVAEEAKREFLRALTEDANPGSSHAAGVRAKQILESARTSIARLSGVKVENVIFTSGATEANNLAIQGHIHALVSAGRAAKDIHVLYLPSAHASVVETIQSLETLGVQTEPLVLTDGAIDLARLKEQLRPETALVVVDVICGETGTRFAVRDVRRTLDAYAKEQGSKRILIHADASQAPFTESFELVHLGADLLTLDAQKVGGIRGIGALVRANSLIPLEQIMYGGGQEDGLRPGTENPALAKAFAEALQLAHEDRESFAAKAEGLREELLARVSAAIPDAIVNVGKEYTPHIVNFSFLKRDTDYAVMLLSEAGYAVSTKSACETDATGSRAVLALTGDQERSSTTLRVSWGPETKSSELRGFAQTLIRTIRFLDGSALH